MVHCGVSILIILQNIRKSIIYLHFLQIENASFNDSDFLVYYK